MSRLPEQRQGEPLVTKGYTVPFSFWPTKKTGSRCSLNTRVFTNDPWLIITNSIKEKIKVPDRKLEALAYCEQSQDFFRSAQIARVSAAKPILLYYAFLNLAKAYILLKGTKPKLSKAFHGLVNMDVSHNTLTSAKLEGYKDSTGSDKINIFDNFYNALYNNSLQRNKFVFNLRDMISQVVVGHRLWLEAINGSSLKRYRERFISVDKLLFMHDKTKKHIWLRMHIRRSALSRFEYGVNDFINKADGGNWKAVKSDDENYVCYEQENAIKHAGSPMDRLSKITDDIKRVFWQTVRSDEPYRRYYLYAHPSQDRDQVLPQLLSIYAIMFYLSSITRYRPLRHDEIIDSKFGAFIESFIESQPTQFLYLMASQFAEREVAKAAIA